MAYEWNNSTAMIHLLNKRGFRCREGIILQPKNHVNSEEDESAIIYLCSEWDYGYQPANYEDKEDIIKRGDLR